MSIRLAKVCNQCLKEALTRNLFGVSLARRSFSTTHGLPPPPPFPVIEDPSQDAQARKWLEEFSLREIPKGAVDFSYSRSSGPGGQNVNKVNTKATLRCPINAPWIPMWAREHIMQLVRSRPVEFGPYVMSFRLNLAPRTQPSYVSSSHSIQIVSTKHRSQAENVQDCLAKLHSAIQKAAAEGFLKKEPSEAQKQRVRELERIAKARRRQEKEKRSQVKRGRGRGGGGDD
ncbi:RF-1 domain-containing protein [Trametes polyzona]|nr:RF-1 domain-containing protein [Trametes polyzona]